MGSVDISKILGGIEAKIQKAVAHFWKTRKQQAKNQGKAGGRDRGRRAAVTGGAQMDGFTKLVTELLLAIGIKKSSIFTKRKIELPGFFRSSKQWDLLVIEKGILIAALETKSHIGPSFGNNFNNRMEEATGSAVDLWTAYRENAFRKQPKPWLGYLLLLEDCPKSRTPVKVYEPHFEVFPEFKDASYMDRYRILCEKLQSERLYDGVSFIISPEDKGSRGAYSEPAGHLGFETFARSLLGKAIAFSETGGFSE